MKRNLGFALTTAILMVAVLMAMAAAYFMLTQIELSTTRSTTNQASGFYAAEAGLNLRAEDIRATFVGYNRPTGTSPTTQNPCTGSNRGSGDFACKTYTINGRAVRTYVLEHPGNPTHIRIPPGELYQNLSAQEYRYSVFSVAVGPNDQPEAILEMRFKSRLVPMFQFAAFYDKDLEILPGATMSLEGPVHTNGDLYLDAIARLDILGQVTTVGDLYHGRKDRPTCSRKPVQVYDASYSLRDLDRCNGRRHKFSDSDLTPWGANVKTHVNRLTVPSPDILDPQPGRLYWDKADLRVALDLNGSTPKVKVYRPDKTVDVFATSILTSICGAAGSSNTFYDNREGKKIQMLEVDMQAMLDCIHGSSLITGVGLDDATQGGLVLYFTVLGPDSDRVNNYGVRVKNGAKLAASDGTPVRGLTVVTDQAVYIQGDFNANDKRPAAFLADSLNVLSNAWDTANAWGDSGDGKSTKGLHRRKASQTTINAAFLAGTDNTGGADGASGQDSSRYNGGLENYPRLHENWSGVKLSYHGSFVSLGTPNHVDGPWVYGHNVYTAPRRDWHYDTDFNDAGKLPPLSPRFVYLRQELFEREFEQH